jgi:DNA-damage-inducible protein J
VFLFSKGEIMTQKIRSNVYLDTELKESAREMFKNYGLSLSDGINFLLKQATEKKSPILDLNIEQINPNDPDYKLVEEARKNRANGEKIYSLDEVMKEFNAN